MSPLLCYIFVVFHTIYLCFYALYICAFLHYIFVLFYTIFLWFFTLYICAFLYYIFVVFTELGFNEYHWQLMFHIVWADSKNPNSSKRRQIYFFKCYVKCISGNSVIVCNFTFINTCYGYFRFKSGVQTDSDCRWGDFNSTLKQ